MMPDVNNWTDKVLETRSRKDDIFVAEELKI
jgi:hypothetical protein